MPADDVCNTAVLHDLSLTSSAFDASKAKHAVQQLEPKGMYCCNVQVCRKAKGPCDAEEKCDGSTKECPEDYCVDYPKKLKKDEPYCPVKSY